MARNPVTAADRERMVTLYREHGNIEVVATIMRRCRKRVSQTLKDEGVTLRFRGRQVERDRAQPPVAPAELERLIRDTRLSAYAQLWRAQIEREAWPR